MTPDRGVSAASPWSSSSTLTLSSSASLQRDGTADAVRQRSSSQTRLGQNRSDVSSTSVQGKSIADSTHFTLRGVLVGTAIGVIICFSNTYFGLQSGWVSGMAMPASLIGFAWFKIISKHLKLPFTPVENVLVQTVAGAVGTMPLGLGFVGVMPSIEFLLKKSEGAPVDLSFWRLVVWGIGLCLFGVVFGVPLRKQVIIREQLKFPSGTATALMISVLHGGATKEKRTDEIETQGTEEREQLLHGVEGGNSDDTTDGVNEEDTREEWKSQIKHLLTAVAGSGIYNLIQYFIPILHELPVFGTHLAHTWIWTLNPSPAYVGQGIIMGPATTLHMLLGAVVGWAILSPVAKNNGWAPGPVDDWENGSKGWIMWISLAIMLADAGVSLIWLVLRPTIRYGPEAIQAIWHRFQQSHSMTHFFLPNQGSYGSYSSLTSVGQKANAETDEPPDDAPAHHLISTRTILIALPATLALCVICVHVSFGEYIPIPLNIFALCLALVLSIMGVRALGETDINPVSGISKLTQLIFALTVPSGKHANHAIMINLLAGAVSESGALQAGDILQDLKAGHLLGASPKAQFYGQLIGSIVGAVVSAAVYRLYVSVYEIPGDLFPTPTAYVWIFTARLVTGKGLPPMAGQYALIFGVVFAITSAVRIWLQTSSEGSLKRKLHSWVPGGIAVAVGMYNIPSFTLARTAGGLLSLWFVHYKGNNSTGVVVLASGLILGEGVVSIINLIMASAGVPHL